MTNEERQKWLETNRVYRKETESLILEVIDRTPPGLRIVFNELRQRLYAQGDMNAHMRLASCGPYILKNHDQTYENEQGHWFKK